MPGEKHPDLRQKLDALNDVPVGFSFDKETAWERVAQELPTRRRVSRWIGKAAAVVLLISGGLWWQTRHHEQPLPTRAEQVEKQRPGAEAPPTNQSTTSVPQPVIRRKETTRTKSVAAPLQRRVQEQPIALSVPDQQPHLTLPPAADSVRTAIAPKPRFRVAHINELAPITTPAPPETETLVRRRLQQGPTDDFAAASARNTETKNKPLLQAITRQH